MTAARPPLTPARLDRLRAIVAQMLMHRQAIAQCEAEIARECERAAEDFGFSPQKVAIA